MTCLLCTAANVRDKLDPKRSELIEVFALHGFVNCGVSEGRATFKPFRSTCKKFDRCDEATAAKRERWAQGLQR